MIKQRLAAIREKIAAYETEYGLDRGTVKLLAVSKKQPAAKIREAYDAGQRLFAENYIQEALPKMEELTDLDIEWHFIGPIQSNKTRKIAEHFHWVQSVDSLKSIKRLNEQRPEHLPPLNMCLEINISNDPHKAGVTPDQAHALLEVCQQFTRLTPRGIMTIPANAGPEAARRDFKAMHDLYKDLTAKGIKLDTLSMGMTGDYDVAIAEGSNMIRIGTGIFGERE